MSSAPPINRHPLGLLGFLGIKNGGRYPQQPRDDALRWVWDLSQVYLQSNTEFVTTTIAATALGSFDGLTVPFGENWYVTHFGVGSGTQGAGESIAYALSVTDPSVTVSVPITMPSPTATTGNRTSNARLEPFLLQTGWRLAVQVTTFTGAAVRNLTCSARIARMTI